jgi:hypothetical protein
MAKKFSIKWFFIGIAIHLALDIVAGIGALGNILGAGPMHNPNYTFQRLDWLFYRWIWNAGPTIAQHLLGWDGRFLWITGILWVIFFGIVVGFLFPRKTKEKGQS